MEYDTSLAKDAYELAVRWDSSRDITDVSKLSFTAADLKDFNSNQISTLKQLLLPQT